MITTAIPLRHTLSTTPVVIREMHAGEMLVGSLCRVILATSWNGTGTPTLRLSAGDWSAAFPLTSTDADTDLGNGMRFVTGLAIANDVRWTTYGPHLTASVDDGAGNDLGATEGSAAVVLTVIDAGPVV